MSNALKKSLNQVELVDGLMREDRKHQKYFYEQYHGRMMAVCMRYSNSYETARDVLHEGFMKVFRNISKYKPTHSLDSWVKRIMINTAIDHYRKNKKHQYQVELDHAAGKWDASEETPVEKMSAQEIMKLVQLLSPAYRTVFNLYVIEGFNHREIAELLNISEGTSKSNLAKARQKLRVAVSEKLDCVQYLKTI